MSDEIFSTTLAYTKSPKATKRTSFQVNMSKHFGFECPRTQHLLICRGVEVGEKWEEFLLFFCCVVADLSTLDTGIKTPTYVATLSSVLASKLKVKEPLQSLSLSRLQFFCCKHKKDLQLDPYNFKLFIRFCSIDYAHLCSRLKVPVSRLRESMAQW